MNVKYLWHAELKTWCGLRDTKKTGTGTCNVPNLRETQKKIKSTGTRVPEYLLYYFQDSPWFPCTL